MKRIVLILAVASIFAGCGPSHPDELQAVKDKIAILQQDATIAKDTAAQLQGQADALTVMIDALPDGPEKDKAIALRDRVNTALGKVKAFLDKAVPAIDRMNAEVQKATDMLDVAESVGKTAVGFAPTPWSGIGLAVIPLVFTLIRAWKNKQAAINIAKSVQPLVDEALKTKPELATQLSIVQGYGGKKIVDQAQGSWGLPV